MADDEAREGASTLVGLRAGYQAIPDEPPEDEAPPNDLMCPITHALMREPVRASDGCVYDRHAITRWFSQRLSSPLTGEQLDSGRLDPCDGLRKRAEAWAAAHRHTREGAAFFGCRYCGDARCPHPEECQKTFESKARLDAAYGAAVRRRAWFEGNVLPPAERALQSGPAGAGALMTGACLVGAVGALLGGVASSVAEVAGMERGVRIAAASFARVASMASPVDVHRRRHRDCLWRRLPNRRGWQLCGRRASRERRRSAAGARHDGGGMASDAPPRSACWRRDRDTVRPLPQPRSLAAVGDARVCAHRFGSDRPPGRYRSCYGDVRRWCSSGSGHDDVRHRERSRLRRRGRRDRGRRAALRPQAAADAPGRGRQRRLEIRPRLACLFKIVTFTSQ